MRYSNLKVEFTGRRVANLTFNLQSLRLKLDGDWHWKWILARMERLWKSLSRAAVQLNHEAPDVLSNRTMLKVPEPAN